MKDVASNRLARDDPWRAVDLAKAERGVLIAAWLRRIVGAQARPIGFGRVIRGATSVSGDTKSALDEQYPRV